MRELPEERGPDRTRDPGRGTAGAGADAGRPARVVGRRGAADVMPGGPPGMADGVERVLAALPAPPRGQLLGPLGAGGGAPATTLAEGLPVSRQAVVKHLAVLDAAGLVSGGRVGREVRYAVRPAALDATARWMAALAADWDRRVGDNQTGAEAQQRGLRSCSPF